MVEIKGFNEAYKAMLAKGKQLRKYIKNTPTIE